MPTLTIEGRKVTVGDEFLKLSPEQQADEVEDIAGQLGIKPGGAAPEEHSFSELPGNIVPSAVNAVKGFWDTITNPVQTAEGLTALPGGAAREAARAILPEDVFNFLDSLDTSGGDKEKMSQVAQATGGALYNRYGTPENFKNTMITDPVGFGLDVASVIGGGAGAMGKGPLASRAAAASPEKALGVSRPAVTKLSEAMKADNVTPQSVADLGPEGMLMDAGPNLRKQGRGVFLHQGEGSQVINDALKNREAGTTQRALEAADDALGSRVNAVEHRERLKQARAGNGRPLYNSAFKNAKMVNTNPVLEVIDSVIEPTVAGKGPESLSPFGQKLTRYRNRLTMMNSGQVTDSRVLQHVYQTIGDDIGEALTKGRTRGEVPVLMDIKKKLEAAIDEATDNGFSKANAKWATDSEIMDAFGFGEDLARNSLTPDEVAARLKTMKPEARAQVLPGLRNWVYEVVGTARNDAAAARALLQRGWTQEKLGMVLGKDRADALAKRIGLERTYAETNQRVRLNSNTGEGIAGVADVADQPILNGNREAYVNAGFTGVARKTALNVIDGVLNRLSSHRGNVTREDLAKMLTASGAERDEIVRLLTSPETMKAFASGSLPAQAVATALKGMIAERSVEAVKGLPR